MLPSRVNPAKPDDVARVVWLPRPPWVWNVDRSLLTGAIRGLEKGTSAGTRDRDDGRWIYSRRRRIGWREGGRK
jgi:hypothetical protein